MVILPWLLIATVLILVVEASDSIMEIINIQEVERVIAERRSNSSRDSAPDHNFLEDDEGDYYPEHFRRNATEDIQDLVGRKGEKLLRSSKSALLVTKKDYLQKDWCKTEPLVQVIREEGCSPVTLFNRFCYGQCNSFYIPRGPRRKGKAVKGGLELAAFKSCAFCKPKLSSWVTVTLRCRKKKRASLRRKRVLRIKQCKCIAEVLN